MTNYASHSIDSVHATEHPVFKSRLSVHNISSGMASVERKLNSASHCCVPLCNGDSRQDFSLSFHRFPKDITARKKWIVKIFNKERRRAELQDNRFYICLLQAFQFR